MKVEEFKKLWPSIEGKEVEVLSGYRSPDRRIVTLVSYSEYTGRSNGIYIKTTNAHECLSVRPIVSIKTLEK